MTPLEQRLVKRFEEEICRICVHRDTSGCALPDHVECPVFKWAEQIAALMPRIQSDKLADYLDEIQSVICPDCEQAADGGCARRDHLDCPLDLYLGLVVPIVEEELALDRGTN